MGRAGLKRVKLGRQLIKRRLDRLAVILRPTTGTDAALDYAPFSILPVGWWDADRPTPGQTANQSQPVARILVLFNYNADVKVSDKVVVGATNIVAGAPITYVGGEVLDIEGFESFTDDTTYLAARCLRRLSRIART